MKKFYLILFTAGLYLFAYIFEFLVKPLSFNLPNSQSYLNIAILTQYPFTTLIIAIRSLALFITPLILFSFIRRQHLLKATFLFLMGGLAQLYVIQSIATGNQQVPLEWSLAISMAGIALVIPFCIHLLLGILLAAHKKIKVAVLTSTQKQV